MLKGKMHDSMSLLVCR